MRAGSDTCPGTTTVEVRVADSLIPRSEHFFDDFVGLSEEIRSGARLLKQMMSSDPPDMTKADAIKDVEHNCDGRTRAIIDSVNRTFVTPLDPKTSTRSPSLTTVDFINGFSRRGQFDCDDRRDAGPHPGPGRGVGGHVQLPRRVWIRHGSRQDGRFRDDRSRGRHLRVGGYAGAAVRRLSAVRWGVAGRIVWAWILTIPASALIAALTYELLTFLGFR